MSFFVHRPIFAIVIALLISLMGILALRNLSVEQFPEVSSPTISIIANYSGASAETVENTVTQIIEQQLTGIDGLIYFSSTSNSNGRASINVVFTQETDPNTAQIEVTNRVQQVESRLPESVVTNGIRIRQSQSDNFLILALYDETDRSSSFDVADYMMSTLYDPLSRLAGVGNVESFGSEYAMRIWLDPNKLRSFNLVPSDIITAIRTLNVEVSAGSLGAQPSPDTQRLTATVTAQSMLQNPEQFRNIIIKHNIDGTIVRVADIARVELGSDSYQLISKLNGHPSAALSLQLSSNANALETSARVYKLIDSLKQQFPDGYKLSYPRESSDYIQRSIDEVQYTLLEAIALVIIVMYLFLGNWRATIIPTLTVPVVVLGTFALLYWLGYTINSLTLFAIVIGIGLLVDDSIVVVENVERLMHSSAMNAKQATQYSTKEVSGSLIGITVVLSVVFLPMAFIDGATGIIYRQFSITLIVAMLLSVVVAMTLTPALCGILLKPKKKESWFQRLFDKLTAHYSNVVHRILKKITRWMILYCSLILLALISYQQLPTGFIPNEDQGGLMVIYTLPEGADIHRTMLVDEEIRHYFEKNESDTVDVMLTSLGQNYNVQGQNLGMTWIKLLDWDKRNNKEQSAQAIATRAANVLPTIISDAQIYVTLPSAVRGLGQFSGFEMQLQADSNITRGEFSALRDRFLDDARQSPQLNGVRAGRTLTAPQLHIDFDQEKASAYGINLADAFNTLNIAWAGSYVNDFMDRGRVKRVYVQSDAPFRSRPEDLVSWTIQNSDNQMVSLANFSTTSMAQRTESLERYNGIASYQIQGSPATGRSSGEAMNEVSSIADNIGVSYSWSGVSYQEQRSSGQALFLYGISILVIFLCLAALYESWSVPICILMVVPFGVLGTVIATLLRGLDSNVYFQVALLATIGLSAKNAIMMIAFMEQSIKQGSSILDAAINSASSRFRPILMTSIAFIAGVMPLATASGVGANSRIAIGSGIVGGTFIATCLSLLFVPLFFVLIQKLVNYKK